jgi:ABC-2 type transport system permease protein
VTSLAGILSLVRLVLRRDRLRLTVWVFALVSLVVGTANVFADLYPTVAQREQLALSLASLPALTAFLGPLYDSSIGGLTVWRSGSLVAVLAGLMAVLTVIRHTREEEETGRRELLGSTPIGRSAPLAAALSVSVGAGAALGIAVAAGLSALGESPSGAIALGLGLLGVVMVFSVVGALAAQIPEAATTARGIGVAVVAAAFLLRVVGDGGESSGLSWLGWVSPVGWLGRLRSFGDERWLVLGLFLGLGVILGSIAFRIMARRDVGAGVVAAHPGPPRAGRGLRGPLGLAWRLQRGALLGWTVGLALIGVVFGSVGDSIAGLLSDNPQLAPILERLGGEEGITDAFFSTAVGMVALVASAYAIRAVLRLWAEEEGLRAEAVLATATPRLDWAVSHLVFGVVGPVVLLLAAGLAMGTTYGVVVGDVGGQALRALGSALVQLPAVWVLTGATIALFGLAPRSTGVSWGLLVAFLVFGQLGQILQFPQWLLNFSPFTHVPVLPMDELRPTPLLILGVIGVALMVAGLIGFRSRDLQSA